MKFAFLVAMAVATAMNTQDTQEDSSIEETPVLPGQVSCTHPPVVPFSFGLVPQSMEIDLEVEAYTSPPPSPSLLQTTRNNRRKRRKSKRQRSRRGLRQRRKISLKQLTKEPISRWDEFLRRAYRAAAKATHPDSGGSSASFQELGHALTLIERWLQEHRRAIQELQEFFGEEMVCHCLQCRLFFRNMRPCPACSGTDSRRGHLKTCPFPQYALRIGKAHKMPLWAMYLKNVAHGMAPDKAKDAIQEARLLHEHKTRHRAKLDQCRKAAEERAAKEDFNVRIARKRKELEKEWEEAYFKETGFRLPKDEPLDGLEELLAEGRGSASSSAAPPPQSIPLPTPPTPTPTHLPQLQPTPTHLPQPQPTPTHHQPTMPQQFSHQGWPPQPQQASATELPPGVPRPPETLNMGVFHRCPWCGANSCRWEQFRGRDGLMKRWFRCNKYKRDGSGCTFHCYDPKNPFRGLSPRPPGSAA